MKTLYWFLWLKKEELKNLIVSYWVYPVGLLLGLLVIFGITYIPWIHDTKPLSLRVLQATAIMLMGALILFICSAVCFVLKDFITDNWYKARRLRKETESDTKQFCVACKSKVINTPDVSGYTHKRCNCSIDSMPASNWRYE